MAYSANTQDIIKGALKDVGELTDGNSDKMELALERCQESYLSILGGASEFNVDCGEPWTWARSQRSFTLFPAYESGTASLVNGSTAGTFSTAPSSSLGSFVNRYFKVANKNTVYQITAHVAGAAAFTLDSAYLEETNSTASFKATPMRYDLGRGILRLVEALRVYSNQVDTYAFGESDRPGKIYGIGLGQLREKYPIQDVLEGTPSCFATQRRSDQEWWIEVNRVGREITKVDFDYIPFPQPLLDSTESVPVIPREFRKVLRYATAHFLAIDKGNENLSTQFYLKTQVTLRAMVKAENKNTTLSGKNKGVLLPRQEQLTKNPSRGY